MDYKHCTRITSCVLNLSGAALLLTFFLFPCYAASEAVLKRKDLFDRITEGLQLPEELKNHEPVVRTNFRKCIRQEILSTFPEKIRYPVRFSEPVFESLESWLRLSFYSPEYLKMKAAYIVQRLKLELVFIRLADRYVEREAMEALKKQIFEIMEANFGPQVIQSLVKKGILRQDQEDEFNEQVSRRTKLLIRSVDYTVDKSFKQSIGASDFNRLKAYMQGRMGTDWSVRTGILNIYREIGAASENPELNKKLDHVRLTSSFKEHKALANKLADIERTYKERKLTTVPRLEDFSELTDAPSSINKDDGREGDVNEGDKKELPNKEYLSREPSPHDTKSLYRGNKYVLSFGVLIALGFLLTVLKRRPRKEIE